MPLTPDQVATLRRLKANAVRDARRSGATAYDKRSALLMARSLSRALWGGPAYRSTKK